MKNQIGNTPLEVSRYLSIKLGCTINIKKEYFNPGGSSKDRIASFIIKNGIDKGLIHKDTTIVEASSGNTAIGLAMICHEKSLKCRIYITDKSSPEKMEILAKLGVQIIKAKRSTGPDDQASSQAMAKKFCQSNPDTYFCNQYFNPMNQEAHYQTTGPEIWQQSQGKITHFICGVGTGGTISGVGRYLKQKNPDIKIIGIEPEGSILSHYFRHNNIVNIKPGSYLVEGIGKSFIPGTFDTQYVDDMIQVSDRASAFAAHDFYANEKLLPGFSSGSVIAGLNNIQTQLNKEDNIVMCFADAGNRYLSKLYNKQWLIQNNINFKIMTHFDSVNTSQKIASYV